MLKGGANINAINNENETPLLQATRRGKSQMPNAINIEFTDCFHTHTNYLYYLYIRSGFFETVELLLKSNADRNIADKTGKTPLGWAEKWLNEYHIEGYTRYINILKAN